MCGSSASPSWRIVSQRFGQGGLRDKDARRARGGCREGRKREEVILDFGSKKRDVRDGEGSELGARRRPRFLRNPPERALFGVSSRAPRERGELFPPLGGSVTAPSGPAAPPATPSAPESLPSAPSTCHGRSCPAFLAMSLTDHASTLLQKHTCTELSLPSEAVRNVRTLTQKTSPKMRSSPRGCRVCGIDEAWSRAAAGPPWGLGTSSPHDTGPAAWLAQSAHRLTSHRTQG